MECFGALNIKVSFMLPIEFGTIVEYTREGKYMNEILHIRLEDDKERRNELKKALPYFTFSKFDGNIRHNSKFISSKHLIFDLDSIDSGSVGEIREMLMKETALFCLFTSPSGNGMKIIFETETVIKDVETYKLTYQNYKEILEIKFSIKLDNTIDPARACFISYDPDIFLNSQNACIPVVHKQETTVKPIKKKSQKYFYTIDKSKTNESRNQKLTSYAGYMKSLGLSYENMELATKGYNQKYFIPPLADSEIDIILGSVAKYKQKEDKKIIYSINELFDDYAETAIKYSNKRVQTIPEFDNVMMGGFLPGEIMGVCAVTGGFKTTFGLNQCIEHSKRTNDLVVYCSLEMSKSTLTQRMLQMSSGLSGKEIWQMARNKDNTFYKLCEASQINLATIDKRFFITDFKKIIMQVEDEYCMKVELVCIDHCGLIKSKFTNEYDRASNIADEMIDIAKGLDIAILSLYQVPREDIKMIKRVTLHSFKGSGNIENSLRYAICFNNISENNFKDYGIESFSKDDNMANGVSWVNMSLEKNTTGSNDVDVLCEIDRKTMRIKTIPKRKPEIRQLKMN